MNIAFATCSAFPDGAADDRPAAVLLDADFAVWDDDTVDWDAYERVVIRSTWDCTDRIAEFLSWCERIGPLRLRNPPDLIAFNADKHYLADLSVPIVPTTFLAPGEPLPRFDGEIVVKPSISAAARDTGRFGPAAAATAQTLVDRIHGRGRTALVQPYLRSVDRQGETSLVFIAGCLSHVLTKRAILRDEGVAPIDDGSLGVAAAMLQDDLVIAGAADHAQQALARHAIAEISERFGVPLYARVDLVADDSGAPLLLELELTDPALYLAASPGAAHGLTTAIHAS
ncbi:MAG TPA: hypothetical protein VLK58_07450 [Conexibacter sp.]|nr:hypothetical protein [Conexibacter sp.]